MRDLKLPGITVVGAISGVLSIVLLRAASLNPEVLSVNSAILFIPGLLFCLALLLVSVVPLGRPLLVSRFRGILKLGMGVLFVAVGTVSYFLAFKTVHLLLSRAFDNTQGPTLAFCGLLGGGVGTALFGGILAVFFPSMANGASFMRVLLAGTTAGLLLFAGARFGWLGIYFFILAWQVLVALIIGISDLSAEGAMRRRGGHRRRS
ncbi:MAG: hypothetical protein AAGD22_04180 [Verrucomicrobiota bacterium]